MMKKFLAVTVLILGIGRFAFAAEKPLKVVTTLSTFADLVRQVGGEEVQVSYVASPRFNPHFIEPKPSDVLKVKQADLLVHGGLDLEAWRAPLLDAAGNPRLFPGRTGELDLSVGIPLLEVPDRPLTRLMGDIHLYGNPHYWLGPNNAKIMARAIAAKLSEIDSDHAFFYRERLSSFLKRLEEKNTIWQKELEMVHGKEVVAYHRSWPYLAIFAGIAIEQFLEPKPGIPPSPKQIAILERYIKDHQIKAIVQETFAPRAASEALAKRTGTRVVTLCQNVGELPEASDYFSWMDYNVRQLVRALGDKTNG